MSQSTIARPVECEGAGLHGGEPVRLRLEPAAAGGRMFVVPGGVEIPATFASVRSGTRATVLAADTARPDGPAVATVEHLLAVLHVLDLDHVRIVVEGPELPAFDGSAAPLFTLVESAGRAELPRARAALELRAPVEVREGDRLVRAEPADAFGFDYTIDFEHPAIGRQSLSMERVSAADFARTLAPARTFGFLAEVEALRADGLAHGATLDNTVVLDDAGVLNEGGLRFPDEFVRHKAVDLIGDLALLGAPLRAFVRVEKGGHRLHHRLVEAILAEVEGERVAVYGT